MSRSIQDCIAKYGAIEGGKWADEAKWCILLEVPIEIQWINSATGKRANHVYCNKDMGSALKDALDNVVGRGLAGQLKTFDGCLMIRDVRGEPGHPSCHSYALAIDLNAATNKLGQEPTLSMELVKCFTDAGFSWGGSFKRKDGMHFSCGGWE
jgi:hypothetical protein